MAMFKDEPTRPDVYAGFERDTPEWFRDAKLGIFVHWGPYSVPAWAEPIGALGTIEKDVWQRHNPYAEWYYNTIRIEGSPARAHHEEVYGGADYDDFLDQWRAEDFNADELMSLVKATGARYFIPTTKHHDGVTLWDAPGTGDRNTVHRGPHRDLVGEMRDAAERAGIRFGVYYSGGLDWHVGGQPPIVDVIDDAHRPLDKAYADYAFDHVADLIERYRPEVLWGDIEWPDAGKPEGDKSMAELFRRFYAARPDGVSNDRWGETHWDFRTSEYEQGRDQETGMWENCRGIGFSFGHNRREDESNSLDAVGAITHFLDVVSRGGNFLLNIGPTASGRVTDVQRATLEGLGAFNAAHDEAIFASRVLDAQVARPSDEPWVRWTRTGDVAHAFVLAPAGEVVTLDVTPGAVDGSAATATDGTTVSAEGDQIRVTVGTPAVAGPVRVDLPITA
ncbi:alpha-L-fucosidase [Microbacterium excoecariae]|uniref:alpha-L-fucosidase n=1 Tax=Microbacterium excoecariae TaxID=2715210 RepID=UPI00140A7EDB|nr:alpha-L-fucosidase [Microbacterium excoecariae]NHI17775.1 alpha-L-fucosidase [Microbacterium excoecariae]